MHNRSLTLLAAVMLFSTGALASEESAVWWMTETYKPSKAKIEGIPVKDIDSTWSKALPLSKTLLTGEAQAYLGTVPYGVFFSVDGDFNADKVDDRALVGVYEKVTGEKGKFLLILTRTSPRSWKKVFLRELGGEPGFSYITADGGTLGWSGCFECDAGEGIIWTKDKGYQVEVESIETD